ncbi:molybdenum cofactor sulfurase [Arthrobacter sp. RIT-PI-e]|uniref:MOSC domain-containing protein n=1 Tax=Arthrobacter sp. RIT-PI-e TaxID=1681197 RepID=UPI000675F414|nr:MOSC domain-containing protein [Arthrobacter sp. RIT-PI-e]KNC17361.1 molybdenum cofactor sulfurase [Arthrobacter sp. RIT-PI-e]
MTTGTVLAVCAVHALLPTQDATGVTAIDKRAVEGPVKVHPLGLTGDIQASRKHHGGPTKAVYAYSQQDADFWTDRLGREVTPGLFGENLRVAGVDASAAVIGERWQVGDEVVLEVTMPRTPCVNFARYLGERSWVKRFAEANRVGTYLSVVTTGTITAGNAIRVTEVPEHGVTSADVYAGLGEEKATRLLDAESAGVLKLTPQVRKRVLQALRTPAPA